MAGKDSALHLFLRQRGALVRYASHLLGDRGEAEDLVQEAWMRFEVVTSNRSLAEPQGYLYRVVRNLILDARRRRSIEQRIFDSEAQDFAQTLPSDQPTADADLAAREELAIIREVMAAMPERMKQAFELHRFHAVRLVDIAARLNISKSTAQELVVEGVERCRRALRRDG